VDWVRCKTAGEVILDTVGLVSAGVLISGLDRAVRRRGSPLNLELFCWGASDTGLGGNDFGSGGLAGTVLAGADIGRKGSFRGERYDRCPSLTATLATEGLLGEAASEKYESESGNIKLSGRLFDLVSSISGR